ncbi:MAG: methyl-accepting chemotaxis protein [Anaerovoracaceae bacterium]
MKNLSISMKLIVGFGLVLLLFMLTVGVALYGNNTIGDQLNQYSQYTLPNNTGIWVIRWNTVSIQRYIAEGVTERNPAKAAELFDLAQQNSEALLAEFDRYASNQRDNSRDAGIAELKTLFAQSGEVRREIAEIMKNPTDENIALATNLFNEKYLPPMNKSSEILIGFSDTAEIRGEEQKAAAKKAQTLARSLLVICALISILLTVLIIFIIRRSIMTPIREIVGVSEEISKGNMHAKILYESRDELGQMAKFIQGANETQATIVTEVIKNLNLMAKGDLRVFIKENYPGDYAELKKTILATADQLNNTMKLINITTEQVNTGAQQVSSGAQALAAGSTEQASSVEELNAAIIEIARQAEENMNTIRESTANIQQAESDVRTGNAHMEELTKAMGEINSASARIANITKVIEDIAFQTNILALNATIEAARAGAAGKGFAVVADEVRSLAARSGEAAMQTTGLIEASIETVEKGTKIARDTAQSLVNVGENAQKVSDSFSQIENASMEQTLAIEQIKDGLNQISSVVQTNASTAEENSAISEEMSAQAITLSEEVAKFKLRKEVPGTDVLPELPRERHTEIDLLSTADFDKY